MAKSPKRYSAELQEQLVRLARSGRSAKDLAREFEPSEQTIRNWVKQAELDDGSRNDGLTSSEREELARLRRENARLTEERQILSKAAAWFAQETEKKSKGSSRS
jgi:transposase